LPDGRIIIRTANFPSAATTDGSTSFRPFTDRLHAMGLKAGIYSDIGRNSCAQLYSTNGLNQPEGTLEEREVGLYGNVDRDIALYFAEWGFDLIKVDACGIRGLTPDSNWVTSGKFRPLGPWVDSESIDPSRDALERVIHAETLSMAQLALDGLEIERRAVFVLHEIDGCPMPEVARALSIPVNTAYSRLRLAREQFQTALRRERLRRGEP
jgi:hypothetical protein